MANLKSCPSEERLAALVCSRVEPHEARRFEEHIWLCAECRIRYEDARASESVLDVLQGNHGNGATGRTTNGATRKGEHAPRRDYVAPAVIPSEIKGYDIKEVIGRGGMGVVIRADSQSTHESVAIKILLEGPLGSQVARRRFEREIECAAGLDHPNIVRIIENGVADGRHYFVMEYVNGWRLDEYLLEHESSLPAKLRLFQAICHAIQHAHQSGVIHRDLKPSNILVDVHGRPKIVDFGLAKPLCESHHLTQQAGGLMGTLPFMAPEQVSRSKAMGDIRSDVYSLGVILFLMLTGELPHDPQASLKDLLKAICEGRVRPPSTLRSGLNRDVDSIVSTALRKNPDKRYQSAAALSSDIRAHLSGHPIEARKHRRWYVLWKNLRLCVDVAPLLMSVAIVVVTAATLWYVSHERSRVQRASADAIQRAALAVQHGDHALARSALTAVSGEHAWEGALLKDYADCVETNSECAWADLADFFNTVPSTQHQTADQQVDKRTVKLAAHAINIHEKDSMKLVMTVPIGGATAAAINPGATRVFVGLPSGLIVVWDPGTEQALMVFRASACAIMRLHVDARGQFLFAVDDNDIVVRIDLRRRLSYSYGNQVK